MLEAESESLVLRLQRQLQDLMRQQQQQQQQQAPQPASQSLPSSIVTATPADSAPSPNFTSLLPGQNPLQPSSETLIQALKTENSTLRNRLVDTEREFIKTSRQSDVGLVTCSFQDMRADGARPVVSFGTHNTTPASRNSHR